MGVQAEPILRNWHYKFHSQNETSRPQAVADPNGHFLPVYGLTIVGHRKIDMLQAGDGVLYRTLPVEVLLLISS